MSATRSYVLVLTEASSCADLSVMCDRHLALQPFNIAIVFSSSRQASLPYVIRLQTAVLYIFNFSRSGMLLELNTARSSPHLDMALAQRSSTSLLWSPSAVNSEPRYLNLKTLSSLTPAHCTCRLLSCAASILSLRTLRSASVPEKF